jgi:DUF4097 and DUF4098 domain-containing protein YvlB
MSRSHRSQFVFPLAVLMVSAVLSAPRPVWAGFDEHATLEGSKLELTNLIGEVHIEGTDSGPFRVDVAVRGDDATRDRVKIETHERGTASLLVRFPLDESTRYVYPELGHRSHSSFRMITSGNDDSWWKQVFGAIAGKQIEVSGSGRGLEIWADVTVQVPRGKELVLRHGAGAVTARNVEGKLNLDTHVGEVRATSIDGDLLVDTGSGSVDVSDVDGDTNIDTGSGSVAVEGITGKLLVDTGSGHVDASDCRGDRVSVDTGSGHVVLRDVTCDYLYVDTGSGSIEATGVSTESAKLDTGSGGITLDLSHMGTGKFVLDTGSGGIDLRVPKDASATVYASPGSGGVRVEFPDDGVSRHSRDDLRFRIGDGEADVELDTGSGSITVSG